MQNWWIYKGEGSPHDAIRNLPDPPPWRTFHGQIVDRQIKEESKVIFQIDAGEIDAINAAIYLRRPLLVTGSPGSGKSTLARSIAYELKLGQVLYWPITTRSTLNDALYRYDAIARLHDASLKTKKVFDIGQYLRLGPLGTALIPSSRPRVLLIDEIDKSDIDLPNELLHIFERGEFIIPEIIRLPKESRSVAILPDDSSDENDKISIENGHIYCNAFPIIILTSNGEREFPPAFLRRCIRLTISYPQKEKLVKIITSHLGIDITNQIEEIIDSFCAKRNAGEELATDQLLNAVYLSINQIEMHSQSTILNTILQQLTNEGFL